MIQLRADAAMELHQAQGGQSVGSAKMQTQAEQLLKAAAELGVKLEPVHPGQTHPLLAPYFMVETPDRVTAEIGISHLNRFEQVEGAYPNSEEQMRLTVHKKN